MIFAYEIRRSSFYELIARFFSNNLDNVKKGNYSDCLFSANFGGMKALLEFNEVLMVA